MSLALQQVVDDVLGAAEDSPEDAAGILADAAAEFRDRARRPDHVWIAAALAARANEFEARARFAGAYFASPRGPGRATKNDFDEIEREQAIAHREVGHLDDLEVRARRNQLEALRKDVRRVSIAPESVTDKTALGRQVNVKFSPTTADVLSQIVQQDTVVLWQGTKTESQAFTVDVGVSKAPALGTTQTCRPFGIVTYGADGYQMSFTFDVGLGVRFTGVGNYCSVLVGMGAPRSGTVSGTMSIGASLGFFAAPSQSPVTLTSYVDGLGFGEAAPAISRPSRASFLLPPQSSDVSGLTQIDFLDYAGAISNSLLYANGMVVAPIPISPEVAAAVLTNKSAAGTANYRLPWMLST